MPPSLSRSSMRYLSARTCPSNGSPVCSRATPSEGHNVVVSGYSTPHFGQAFIDSYALANLPTTGNPACHLSFGGEYTQRITQVRWAAKMQSEKKMRAQP